MASLGLALASPAYAQTPETVSSPPAETGSSPLEAIIADYEAFARRADPSEKAREEDRAPREWSDISPAYIDSLAEQASALKERLNAVEDKSSPEWKIIAHLLERYIVEAEFDTARIPFNGDWGFQAAPLFAARQLRIESQDDAEAWIARLNDLPRYIDDNITNMRRGLRTGWTAHSDPLKTTTDQIRKQAGLDPEDSALWQPFEKLPETIDEETRSALRESGREAVARAIGAYEKALAFMEATYAPRARPEPGIGSLPRGQNYYAAAIANHTAGAGYSPEEIHALGKREVARIRAGMEAIIEEIEYPGSFEEFQAFLRNDPQFYAETPEDLMERPPDFPSVSMRSCRNISARFPV
jgi:uncharacterized protein (DUF885 family)